MIRLKKARLRDISRMQELVKEEVQNGVILPLESDEIAANIRSYVLAFGCDSKADTSFGSKENLSFDSKENSDSNLARNSDLNLARNVDLNLIQSSAANFAENPAKKFAENAAGHFAPQLATPQSAGRIRGGLRASGQRANFTERIFTKRGRFSERSFAALRIAVRKKCRNFGGLCFA